MKAVKCSHACVRAFYISLQRILSILLGKGRAEELNREFTPFRGYFVFSEVELFSLILCIVLDISEYMAAVLLMPVIGDMLDIAGIVACLLMFQWIGVITFFELVPGADILPIFIITWMVWYFLKKSKRREAYQIAKKRAHRTL